jgi:hypothetical protein
MGSGSRSGSWLAVAVAVVVAAVAVVGFVVIRHSVDNQDVALLHTQAGQVTQLLQSALSQQGTSLAAIDAVAKAGGSTAEFEAEAAPFTTMPNVTVALVDSGRVVAVSGHGLSTGQALPAPLAAAIAGGGPQLFSSGIMRIDGNDVLSEVVGGGPQGPAVIEMSVVDPR